MSPSLQLEQLVIGHQGQALTHPLTASLRGGDFVCLVGRNGSGKSTLLHTLAGLLTPVAGRVASSGPAAIVLTALPDLRHTSVRALVAYGRLPHSGFFGRLSAADLEAADRALRLVGIADLAPRMCHELSDGERQKTMIAMALAEGRDILLLDEPSAFLDYPSRRELMQLLADLAHHSEMVVLLSTHDLELASSHADRLWLLRDGRLDVLPASDLDLTAF